MFQIKVNGILLDSSLNEVLQEIFRWQWPSWPAVKASLNASVFMYRGAAGELAESWVALQREQQSYQMVCVQSLYSTWVETTSRCFQIYSTRVIVISDCCVCYHCYNQCSSSSLSGFYVEDFSCTGLWIISHLLLLAFPHKLFFSNLLETCWGKIKSHHFPSSHFLSSIEIRTTKLNYWSTPGYLATRQTLLNLLDNYMVDWLHYLWIVKYNLQSIHS